SEANPPIHSRNARLHSSGVAVRWKCSSSVASCGEAGELFCWLLTTDSRNSSTDTPRAAAAARISFANSGVNSDADIVRPSFQAQPRSLNVEAQIRAGHLYRLRQSKQAKHGRRNVSE